MFALFAHTAATSPVYQGPGHLPLTPGQRDLSGTAVGEMGNAGGRMDL